MTDLALLPNPFRDNVVQDAWQATAVDLLEIHARAFDACLEGLTSASRGVPDSLVIYGAAGSGKTHLLARLQAHLAQTARTAPDSVLRCVFSFVRLQTSPQLLWQHVRRRLVSDLMRREQGLTQLQRLVAHQLGIVDGKSPRASTLELRVLRTEDDPALVQHLLDLGAKLDLPRDLCVALEHLIFNRNVRDATAWLAGDSLPEGVLGALGLGLDLDEDREDVARRIVIALCRLAGETLPIVFCFDQVESLQRTATDDEAFFRFGRMAADLYDADANVFLITCLQATLVEPFRRAVRQADHERIARRSVTLEPLTRAQVEKLLQSRLDAPPDLAKLRAEHPNEPFYPLGAQLVRQLAAESPCIPRRVLTVAARAFEERQRGGPQAVRTTAQVLAGELEARQRQSMSGLKPSDTERILVRGAGVLAELTGASLVNQDPEGADVVIDGATRAALSILNEADGRRLTPKLKALLARTPRRDGAKLVILRDARLPISKTAAKAREHLASLRERGVALVEPTVEALAALDALASILGDAKSGDLSDDDAPLEPGAVLAWLRSLRHNPSLEPVEELVTSLFGESAHPSDEAGQDLLHDLVALVGHEHVIEVERAARALNATVERTLACARRAVAQCLVLEGPPAVLLDVAGVALESEVAS